MDRRTFLGTLTVSALAAPVAAEAQPSTTIPRIGLLADAPSWRRRPRPEAGRAAEGCRAGELPFEQPTRYHLVINHKTATALPHHPAGAAASGG